MGPSGWWPSASAPSLRTGCRLFVLTTRKGASRRKSQEVRPRAGLDSVVRNRQLQSRRLRQMHLRRSPNPHHRGRRTVIGLTVGGFLGVIPGTTAAGPTASSPSSSTVLLTLPPLLLALLLIQRSDQIKESISAIAWLIRTEEIMITLGRSSIAPFASIVRAQTLALREREFVLAARSVGAGTARDLAARSCRTWFRRCSRWPSPVSDPDCGRGCARVPRAQRRDPTPTWGKLIEENRNNMTRLVGDDLPVSAAVPHGAVVQPDRRPIGAQVRHPRGGRHRIQASTESQGAAAGGSHDVRDPLPIATWARARAVDGVTLTLERGPGSRHRRRVGLRQDHPVALDHGPAPHAERRAQGSDPLRGPGDRRPSAASRCATSGGGDGDDLPGPDDLAEPADADRRPDRRAAAGPPRHGPRRLRRTTAESCCKTSRIPEPASGCGSTRTSCRAACASAS